MLSVIACGICGGDPATDTMLVNAAVAGAVSMPGLSRQDHGRDRRLRGKPEATESSCAIETHEVAEPSSAGGTVSVPLIPRLSCPASEQKIVYSPGSSSALIVRCRRR